MHPGHGLGHLRLGGWRWAAGDEVEIADGGAPQVDGVDAHAPAALVGQEGDHVGGARRQTGQGVCVAPGAPGAHAGAVGKPRVRCLGVAGIGEGCGPSGAERAVMGWDYSLGDVIEPGADFLSWPAGWRHHLRQGGQGARRCRQHEAAGGLTCRMDDVVLNVGERQCGQCGHLEPASLGGCLGRQAGGVDVIEHASWLSKLWVYG